MSLSHAFAWIFAGAFLANFVPHFVQGICGNRFPTPFAKPPGRGLSSPLTNTLWGLLNFLAGGALFYFGQAAGGGWPAFLFLFAGAALISIPMSIRFAKKHKE